MADVTRRPAKLWGSSIVGFGSYHYKYASGREGDFMLTGFANRKQALTLYVKDLDAIDLKVLRQLVRKSVAHMRKTYPTD